MLPDVDLEDSAAGDSTFVCTDLVVVLVKTSPQQSSPSRPEGDGKFRAQSPEQPPQSPALSTASTADCDLDSSPVLPSLPAPTLPTRALELLRTPPPSDAAEDRRFVTASWGSPYPHTHREHLRQESLSSEASEDSPIHQLEIHTPFLRPPPEFARELANQSEYAFVSAAVLANRARRPTRGLTEEWIRQHTAADLGEGRHWLSDGTGDSEPSSLSGSVSGELDWLDPYDLQTPRANPHRLHSQQVSRRHPRTRSSVETLTPESLARMTGSPVSTKIMATMEADQTAPVAVPEDTAPAPVPKDDPVPATPPRPIATLTKEARTPKSPRKSTPLRAKSSELVSQPRPKKKVPWKGKNIMVLLPLDDQRGQPNRAPVPLKQEEVDRMFRDWEELGYDVHGFDLNRDTPINPCESSQSRAFWPDHQDMEREHRNRQFTVTLPDLNAWRDYVNELNEAKLRALGVSSHDEEPAPLPSISPVTSNTSRNPSSQHPGQPFSPPIPPSSASSNHFPFPAPFIPGGRGSAVTSPGIPPTTSPVSFGGVPGKYNPRQSISIPASSSPFQFPPQPSPQNWTQQALLMQATNRGESPALSLNGLISPSSPFQAGGSPAFNTHQRHQSLQYPILPHQQLPHFPARATPTLQELREVDEDGLSKSPSKTPEASRENPDELQREIDDAEYHLEEQLRNELEHEDYSPHNQDNRVDSSIQLADPNVFASAHGRQQSVQFSLPEQQVLSNAGPDPVLHHPRPHSRGHSLSHNFFMREDESRAVGHDNPFGRFKAPTDADTQKAEDAYEIVTNPSNLGTPIQDFDLASALQHQRSFSTASNPWNDASSVTSHSGARQMSHGSKPSVSKLNVEAPEFKFNPESTFKPSGQFVFGGNAFQPQPTLLQTNPLFQAPPLSATSSQFSMSTTSRINANAPVFSPSQSDFNFASSGPKFRPDAPAFTPFGGAFSDTITSPFSGSENGGKRTSSIFGNIEIPTAEIVKPEKKSKAIPIVRPSSGHSSRAPSVDGLREDASGRLIDESRFKRIRAFDASDADSIPLFAEPSPLRDEAPASPKVDDVQKTPRLDIPSDHKSGDEAAGLADTSMSSMLTSEATDAKPTAPTSVTSPSETSPYWGSFEFESREEMQSFDNALPPGEMPPSFRGHKKSLSATAKPFTPGAFAFGRVDDNMTDEKADMTDEEKLSQEKLEETERDEEKLDEETPIPHVVEIELPREQTEEVEDGQEMENALEEELVEAEAEEEQVLESEPEPAPKVPIREATPPPLLHRVPQGLAASRYASPPPKPRGLAASRFATATPEPEVTDEPSPEPTPAAESDRELPDPRFSPSPEPTFSEEADAVAEHEITEDLSIHHDVEEAPFEAEPLDATLDESVAAEGDTKEAEEPVLSFEEIDAVMRHINDHPAKGVNRTQEGSPRWHQPSPTRQIPLTIVGAESPLHLPPAQHFRSDAPSPSPRRYHALPGEVVHPTMAAELDDPFIDAPVSVQSFEGAIHRLDANKVIPGSDWDEDFSEAEQEKLESRVQFFDGRVNEVVGNILASRLDPVERSLDVIQQTLATLSRRGASSRRERRSVSQESDADDEDEEPLPPRSMSPQRNRRVEQIRSAVLDALASHQQTITPTVPKASTADNAIILKALEEMKEHFGSSMRLDFRGDDLRNIVEEAVERRIPPTTQPDPDMNTKLAELQAKVVDLEQRLHIEQIKVEKEVSDRRAAQDRVAELGRALETAETKVEVEIYNRSVFDQRITDLEEKLRAQEEQTEKELDSRRAAEDRLSEVQRLLRISTEEETRLRETLDERDMRIKSIEQASGKTTMRLALLEAAQTNATQSRSEQTNRINVMESDLRNAKQEVAHWRSEAEHAGEKVRRLGADLDQALNEKRHLHKVLDTLGTQLEENERVRETWRSKFLSIQEDMAQAAAQITEENARRSKKEQALIARQEVLDAKLQAEARTRERLETELERLEGIERQGMRAVNESKRLETILIELRNENHQLHQAATRYQREFEEARESGASEVQRVRVAMQTQLDEANNHVNVVREDLEEQISKLRAELDHTRIDVDSAKAQSEMLLEEAQSNKTAEIQQLIEKHQNEVDDMQTRYERQLSNAVDDAQSREERLLERLSLSSSRTEHLQDRIIHLEEKLEIAQEAARAAAQAAKTAPAESMVSPSSTQRSVSGGTMALPEKISPQALRESIMVLQEQLQEREQRIEELQHTIASLDPEAEIKITKRDEEIIWLRELLAVRHGDLQDIIGALSAENFDRARVKDAAIRLKANLQMEEQERERAMNGGSSVNLPSIAQTIREAATPRVAQAVGPIAAAWGSWRKAQPSLGSLSGVLSSPASGSVRSRTPSKAGPSNQNNNLLGGLLTPPTSGLRQTPPTAFQSIQPAAFNATGRRYTGQRSEDTGRASISSRRSEKMPVAGTPPRHAERPEPVTPPMMERSGYDSDANLGDFDDHGFFDD
ncbi:hypothetical protein jhhlp_003957 [Lomentospora prolificans]|uniref:Myosin class II heavy chain n=1 Tax=Lomentospora prolificans TaxID=41688 RepID=A0A2N3NA80_9PEZI|nr:hypothetical protein jhhlp_003957 [Lomentospora prolificans]